MSRPYRQEAEVYVHFKNPAKGEPHVPTSPAMPRVSFRTPRELGGQIKQWARGQWRNQGPVEVSFQEDKEGPRFDVMVSGSVLASCRYHVLKQAASGQGALI